MRSSSATDGRSSASLASRCRRSSSAGAVGRGCTTEAVNEHARLPRADELSGVHVRQGGDPEAGIPDQLGKDAAGTERDERPEDGILDDARQQLDAALQHRLDERGQADPLDCSLDGRLVR